jgi:hypothetical protein
VVLAAVLLVPLSFTLQACSDGYPNEDAVLISPFDMRNEQRIEALNQIGARAHREQNWHFELAETCQLKVSHKRQGSRAQARELRLDRSMDIEMVFEKQDETFDLHLMASADADADRLAPMLVSTAWTEAVQADLLLQLLIRDCAADSASDTRPGQNAGS